MSIDRIIELLEIEKECASRRTSGCDRMCDNCAIVQNDQELIKMYTNAISLIKEHKQPESPLPCMCGRKTLDLNVEVVYYQPIFKVVCPSCGRCSDMCSTQGEAIQNWNRFISDNS